MMWRGFACLHERDGCECHAVGHVPDRPDGGNAGAAELVHHDRAALLCQLDARLCMQARTGNSASRAPGQAAPAFCTNSSCPSHLATPAPQVSTL